MAEARPMSTTTKLLIDFGPLLVFFIASMKAVGGPDELQRAITATIAFMIATAVSIVVSKVKTGHVSAMLWVTGVIVLVFGALTVYLRDERFIQIKPSAVYATFAAVLFFGLLTGRPILKAMLEAGFPEMADAGWRTLTRNWAWFFVAMTVLNEIVRREVSFDHWVLFKVWGATTLSFLFALAQAPVLMKHGVEPEETPPPPTQG